MNSPSTALAWEIWQRGRKSAWVVIGLIAFGWFFNLVIPDSFRETAADRERLLTMNCMLMAGSFVLVFGIYNFTEFNAQKEWTGFPYRLFAFPVPTWLLVALPICLGIASIELIYLAWVKLVFTHSELAKPVWLAVLMGSFLAFYQTILWSLAGLRLLRIIMLSLLGTSLIGVGFLPFFAGYINSPWLSENILIALLSGMTCFAFVVSWNSVARQRCGGGRRRSWLKEQAGRIVDALPSRSQDFQSMAGAQFWFEWRRAGALLPACVGCILVLVLGPLSWLYRNDAEGTLWILGWTLAMPVILATPIGKGFSQPDFWSRNLSVPPFLAVRPLATGEMVVIKMKVAALGAALSWLLVIAFLSVWLPLWARLDSLSMMRIGFWMAYDHSVYPQHAMAILTIIAGMLLTWKFLAGGLWIGLSGNMKLFMASVAFYCLVVFLGIIGLIVALNHDSAVRAWIRDDPDKLLSLLEWILAFAVIAKIWMAVFSWRSIAPERVHKYLLIWLAGVLCLIALAILEWAHGTLSLTLTAFLDFLPLDVYRLRNLLILIALLLIPFARLGLAPSSFAKNRHGSSFVRMEMRPANKLLVAMAVMLSGAAVLLANCGQIFSHVDAGGQTLRMLLAGSGDPTVVFEAGAGSSLETWTRVQPEVSKFAGTISYDRAGNGLSKRGATPRDGRRIATELHTALHNAHASPPYVLVGHSLGGPYIRVFAGMFPDEVAGMVLVDPTQEELIDWAKTHNPKPTDAHQFRPYDEVDCAPATFAQARENPVPTNIPVILITGQGPRVTPGFLTKELREEVEKDQKIFYPAKLKFHKEWVEKFPGGQLIITDKSGHGIPFEEPILIVNAIHKVVDQARSRRNPSLP